MRLLVADDHPIVLEALLDMLKRAGHEILGTATDGDQALRSIKLLQPDAAILDVTMPGKSGTEVLCALRAEGSRVPVVLLTGTLEDATLLQAVRANVDGIVLKESATDMLLVCLSAVQAGRQWIDREAMARALQLLAQGADLPRLTPRQTDILALVARGMRNREIAEELGMSEGTVKAHLSSVFEKVGVSSRTELMVRARDLRLI